MNDFNVSHLWSEDSERGVLGFLFIYPQHIDEVFGKLDHREFYHNDHRVLFRVAEYVYKKHNVLDGNFVVEFLKERRTRSGQIIMDATHAWDLIFQVCAPNAIGISQLKIHIDNIRELHRRRTLATVLFERYDEIVKGVTVRGHDEISSDVFARLLDISAGEESYPRKPTFDDIESLVEIIEKPRIGTPTGIRGLDLMLGGWFPSYLCVFAGKTGHGKTALALRFVHHAAFEKKIPSLVFSLEMSREQIMMRLMALEAGLAPSELMNPNKHKTDKEIEAYTKAAGVLYDSPVFIDDTARLTISQIKYRTSMEVKRSGVKLVIVDYIQIAACDETTFNREQEVARIVGGLKQMAKDLNVCVIALSQLSRETDRNRGGRPRLSNLRESGSIEQDADVVGLIYRPDGGNGEGAVFDEDMGGLQDKVFLLIDKHRHGETGEIKLMWDNSIANFVEEGWK